jgi:hypothetical protein
MGQLAQVACVTQQLGGVLTHQADRELSFKRLYKEIRLTAN